MDFKRSKSKIERFYAVPQITASLLSSFKFFFLLNYQWACTGVDLFQRVSAGFYGFPRGLNGFERLVHGFDTASTGSSQTFQRFETGMNGLQNKLDRVFNGS